MYSDTWANLRDIAGTTPANQIDDKFRVRFLGIEERMNDALVNDWTADPVVVKDSVLGKVTGKVLVIPHTAFRERASAGSPNATLGEISAGAFGDSGVLQAPVVLPPGVTVKQIEFLVNNIGSGSILWEFYRFEFSTSPTPIKTVVTPNGSGSSAVSGLQVITSAVLSEVILGSNVYHVSLDYSNSNITPAFVLYAARITYDTPSSSQTI